MRVNSKAFPSIKWELAKQLGIILSVAFISFKTGMLNISDWGIEEEYVPMPHEVNLHVKADGSDTLFLQRIMDTLKATSPTDYQYLLETQVIVRTEAMGAGAHVKIASMDSINIS